MVRVFALVLCISVSFPLSALTRFEALYWVDSQTPSGVVLRHKELVSQIYASNGNQLIWHDKNAVAQFERLLEVVSIADISDLFFHRLLKLKKARAEHQAFEYDIAATDTLLSYLSYTELAHENGKAWFFGAKVPDFLPDPSETGKEALFCAIDNSDLAGFLRQYFFVSNEQNMLYATLESLKGQKFRYSPYTQRGLKRYGDTLGRKAALVERIAVGGVDVSGIDLGNSTFDSETEKAVIKFQELHGLKPDGIIGKNTMKWLNTPIETRVKMLALNSERLRLWEADKDDAVIVNVPDFRLRYWREGEARFETKVIVGRKSRKTPLLDIRMNAVILNPTWNVPRKIMIEDIIPAIKRDESYLAKHQYQILTGWVSEQSIDPEQLDWESVNPENFPYRFRQYSGPGNALGLYKFNTPNRSSIFLHDTPSKYLFDKESRAYSSGCIRVQDADKLANLLFTSRTSERMKKKLADIENMEEPNYIISLNQSLPVHIIYQTVWVESGEVQYRSDIYKYDSLNQSETLDQKLNKLSTANKLLVKQ